MKKTGIVKLLIVGAGATLIFVLPWPPEPEGVLTSPIIPFFLMSFIVPGFYLLIRKEKKETLKWPSWNINLFNPKETTSLGNVDFFGTLFVSIGLSMVISNKINYNELSGVGLTSVSFGLGVLCGLFLTIAIGKRSQ